MRFKLFVGAVALLSLAISGLATSAASASQTECLSYGYACTPGYNATNTQGTWAWSHYGGSWAVNANGYHNCTLYAAWRLAQNGMGDPGNWGDAVDWIQHTSSNHTPTLGSIAWWGGTYGHVAYVEAIRGSEVFVRADNYAGTTANGYTDAGWIPASSVGAFLHPHDLPTETHNPLGSYDLANSPTPGMARIGGWAFDPDAKTSPVTIHAYVGAEAGQPGAEGHNLGVASNQRPDVGAAYPGVGDYHGFDFTFETPKRGLQPICVYAINLGAGGNTFLGCKTVAIGDPNPLGSLDLVESPKPGTIRVGGWAFDPNSLTTPATIHAYIGGEAGQPGTEGHNLGPAGGERPDVGHAFPGVGNFHGFDFTFATSKVGKVPVCVYAINSGPGMNVLIACRSVSVTAPSPPPAPEATAPVAAAPPSAVGPPTVAPHRRRHRHRRHRHRKRIGGSHKRRPVS
ncbi:MAG TPA: CHAP domain-containing protein [Solirubrobacterales bacterium]|nr:CHAP domain-containing protein [Solirubrobacterales bacterium]